MATDSPSTGSRADQQGQRGRWLAYAVVAVAALVLYAATATRGAQWQDSGWHIWRIVTGELHHPLGLALCHPLHYWLGRLVILPNGLAPCWAITLVSAIAAGIAVANVFGCVVTLTRDRRAALLAAVSLGFAHTFWQMAGRTEVYTLTAALFSGELWCLALFATTRRPKYLWGALLLNGLGIANHLLALLTTPILAGVLLVAMRGRQIRLRDLFICGALWLVGSLPYTGLVLLEMLRSGEVSATMASALFGNSYASRVLSATVIDRSVLVAVAFMVLSFPNLLIPSAVYGLVRAKRVGVPALWWRVAIAALVVHVWFVIRYDIVDRHTFLLPAYVILSMLGGVGYAMLLGAPRRGPRVFGAVAAIMLALTPVLYTLAPQMARRFDVLGSVAHNKPYRDDYIYLFSPWSVMDDSADRMSREALALAGDDGLIYVEDRMAAWAIRYRARQAGVQVVDATEADPFGASPMGDRAIVLVPRSVRSPQTDPPIGSWERHGDLYLLAVP